MKTYLLAHDLGTTGDKATLFSEDGTLVRSVTKNYNTNFFHGNYAEQDPEDWWAAFCQTTKTLMQGIPKEDVLCVSFDGAYGRVELGADYIELILYSGEVKVRTFLSPHRPYRVMYAGRYRICDIDASSNTVTLDSTLSVTKTKKLTVLIDLTK